MYKMDFFRERMTPAQKYRIEQHLSKHLLYRSEEYNEIYYDGEWDEVRIKAAQQRYFDNLTQKEINRLVKKCRSHEWDDDLRDCCYTQEEIDEYLKKRNPENTIKMSPQQENRIRTSIRLKLMDENIIETLSDVECESECEEEDLCVCRINEDIECINDVFYNLTQEEIDTYADDEITRKRKLSDIY